MIKVLQFASRRILPARFPSRIALGEVDWERSTDQALTIVALGADGKLSDTILEGITNRAAVAWAWSNALRIRVVYADLPIIGKWRIVLAHN